MKACFAAIFLSFVLWFPLSGQEFAGIEKDLKQAFAKNDARQLANHFANTLVIELPGKSGTYSKSQAQMIVRDFFATHKGTGFSIDHRGQNRDGSHFFIGTYSTAGQGYRVYMVLQNQQGKMLIHQLNIATHDR